MANPSKVLATVAQVIDQGEGVHVVSLKVDPRFTRFSAGQFLHLALDEYDPSVGFWPESRVFSIASLPRQDLVTIVFSVKGTFTARMERELVIGRKVWLKLPYGDFIIRWDETYSGPLILVAGGTGISPFLPYLLSEGGKDHETYLFYGIRKPSHLLFKNTLSSLCEESWFHGTIFVEEGKLDPLPFSKGRLSVHAIQEGLGAEFLRGRYYLSGPPDMIRSFRTQLSESGIPKDRICIDEWG